MAGPAPRASEPCDECGVHVPNDADHTCDPDVRISYLMNQERGGILRFEEELGDWLETPKARFEAFLAAKDREHEETVLKAIADEVAIELPYRALEPFSSERLLLRPLTDEDAPALAAVYRDPKVARFVAAPATDVSSWLEPRLAHQRRHGFGLWAVVLKESGRLIGDGGLEYLPSGEVELGGHLASAYWGRGYAKEGAKAWLRVAFEKFDLPRVYALSHPGNEAARRVAENLGFRRAGSAQHHGRTLVRYRLSRRHFEAARV